MFQSSCVTEDRLVASEKAVFFQLAFLGRQIASMSTSQSPVRVAEDRLVASEKAIEDRLSDFQKVHADSWCALERQVASLERKLERRLASFEKTLEDRIASALARPQTRCTPRNAREPNGEDSIQ